MIDKQYLLSRLSGFTGSKLILKKDQEVKDIIGAMMEAHKIYASDYDKISGAFYFPSGKKVALTIFNFLKNNVKYKIEPDSEQRIMSPAAILTLSANDCKNYALFAGGVIDAINRSGLQYIPYAYRFVSHQLYNDDPNHVFVVVNPNTANEIFIDPIPEHDDIHARTPYYYSLDKKISGMALYRVSGVQRHSIGAEPVSTAMAISQGLKAGSQTAKDITAAIFSKNGVPASFFERFPFLKFLDNSVGQWKSKSAAMKGWTPEQRIAYYIDRINAGDSYHNAVQQYAELYGAQYNPQKGTPDDRGKVPAELLALFNHLAEDRFFRGAETIQDGANMRLKSQVLNDLKLAPDYSTYVSKLKKQQSGGAAASAEPAKAILPLALLSALLFKF